MQSLWVCMYTLFPPKLILEWKCHLHTHQRGPWLKCHDSAPFLPSGSAKLSVSLAGLRGLRASIAKPRRRPVLSFNRVPYSSGPIPIYRRPRMWHDSQYLCRIVQKRWTSHKRAQIRALPSPPAPMAFPGSGTTVSLSLHIPTHRPYSMAYSKNPASVGSGGVHPSLQAWIRVVHGFVWRRVCA